MSVDAEPARAATPATGRWDAVTISVTAGFTLGWVLGAAGGMLGPGIARETAWAVSSAGILAAAMVLAFVHASRDVPLAAGLALLALGEVVIHTQGPDGIDALASAAYAYVPGLLLTATSRWPQSWARVTAVGAAIAFAVHGGSYLAGNQPGVDGLAISIGYALLGITMIGWTLRAIRSPTVTSGSR